jgi:hypothetical protein
MDENPTTTTDGYLAAMLAGAISAADAWRHQAGHDSHEAARRDRLIWQLQHIAKQMLTPQRQSKTQSR